MERMRLALDASLTELARLGAAVQSFGEGCGLDAKLIKTLQLVCDEWVTNVIVHGYGGATADGNAGATAAATAGASGAATGAGSGEKPIELTMERPNEETVRLTFTDGAPPFDPLARPAPDVTLPVDEREIGGLGIHFIRTLMDRCAYVREGNYNKLVLEKRTGERGEKRNDGHSH